MLTEFKEMIAEFGLEKHLEFLVSIARPCVNITCVDLPATMGCSKFGGCPDLPTGFEWPRNDVGAYRFIGQINLRNIPPGPHGLPSTGLLSFFHAPDEDDEYVFWEPGFIRVFRFEATETLKSSEPPEEVAPRPNAVLEFELGMDVPSWPRGQSAQQAWPLDAEEGAAYWKLRLELHPTKKYLLGYPLYSTLAYDPTPGPEWRSLFTSNSDYDLEWTWGDGDWLMIFIQDQRLQSGDFSTIECAMG